MKARNNATPKRPRIVGVTAHCSCQISLLILFLHTERVRLSRLPQDLSEAHYTQARLQFVSKSICEVKPVKSLVAKFN
jgi:hypothetical protein